VEVFIDDQFRAPFGGAVRKRQVGKIQRPRRLDFETGTRSTIEVFLRRLAVLTGMN
jgi:hypothetical protein